MCFIGTGGNDYVRFLVRVLHCIQEKIEEHNVEDVRKQKAKSEQQKVQKKGFFRRFQRKSMG